jgi:hypothetical protein
MNPTMILNPALPVGAIYKERIFCGSAAPDYVKEMSKREWFSCHPDTWANATQEFRDRYDVIVSQHIIAQP